MPQGAEYLGKYRLLQPLARGGMAELYLARQEGIAGFEKTVVIKRVLPHLAQYKDFAAMFLDEARIAAKLSHPNIVQYFDFGEAEGSYYIAMEYLAGEDLTAIVRAGRKRGRRLPEALAAFIMAAACDGLHYAHTLVDESGRALNIVHRDISPSNIFVTYQGTVKVLDFGIAKAEGKLSRTRSGLLKGKYLYMSPEQVRGDPLDGRSDVFALGSVLYEILTDAPAFMRETELDTLRAIMLEDVEPPRSKAPEISEAMEAIILKALAPSLERRFRSALHMRKALEEYLSEHATGAVSTQLQSYVREIMGDDRVEQRLRPATFAATRQRTATPPSNSEESAPPLFEADSGVRAARSEALLEAHTAVRTPERGSSGPGADDLVAEGARPTLASMQAKPSEPDQGSTRPLRPSGADPSERTTIPEEESAGEVEPAIAPAAAPEPSLPPLSGAPTGPQSPVGARAPSSARGPRKLALVAALGAMGAGFALGMAVLGRHSCGVATRDRDRGNLTALASGTEPGASPADAASFAAPSAVQPLPGGVEMDAGEAAAGSGPPPDAASSAAPSAVQPPPVDAGEPVVGAGPPLDAGLARPTHGPGRAPAGPAHPRAPAPPPPDGRPSGLLKVVCSLPCNIFIDGVNQYALAPKAFKLSQGRHLVRVVKIATKEVKERAVDISPTTPEFLSFDLSSSAPDDASAP